MDVASISLRVSQAHKIFKPFRFYLLMLFFSLLMLLVLLRAKEEKLETFSVQHERVKLNSPAEIIMLKNTMVKPVLYTNLTGLDKLPVRQAKFKFIAAVLPAVLVAKHEIDQRRSKILWLQKQELWSATDSSYFDEMKSRYRAKDMDDLLHRVITLPNSIVLAQAAVESGWGKSRFFLLGNNLFGVWSFNVHEPRIPALLARKDKRTYLRSYDDMSQSIIHYHEILARSRSYKSLREARVQTQDPFELLPHLKNFSERRVAYTNQLKRLIQKNNLTQFDTYEIDPLYLKRD